MRLGYSFWGFLGDHKMDVDGNELSTPDGNATYSWSIIHEAQRRGWQVYLMQEDRDTPAWDRMGPNLFRAFSKDKRTQAYRDLYRTAGRDLPDLDVLLVEWRFPIPGRNTPEMIGQPGFQPDFLRQREILEYYMDRGTKVIVWDLDHKLTRENEIYLGLLHIGGPAAIFETSVQPKDQLWKRTRVEPPTVIEDLLQFGEHYQYAKDKRGLLSYIGSRYERDDVITEYIGPVSDRFPESVHFYGNWMRTVEECRKLWPNVTYHDRVTTKDFLRIYSRSLACPLLAKRSYIETGFITPRPWEAIIFGAIPIGIAQTRGIDQYCLLTAASGKEMGNILADLKGATRSELRQLREESAHKLLFMDVKNFVDKIEDVI